MYARYSSLTVALTAFWQKCVCLCLSDLCKLLEQNIFRERRNRNVYLQQVAMNLALITSSCIIPIVFNHIYNGGTFNAAQFYKTVTDKSCRHVDITFYTQTGIHQQESPDSSNPFILILSSKSLPPTQIE